MLFTCFDHPLCAIRYWQLKLKTDPAQLGDAPHGVLHQPPRHPADGSLPEVASPMEKNP